ncbi:MAG: hypothetical protein IJZ46_04950 [Bacilli bacterium]|nr:hypothetical protein [Bacilli bacterium]
MNNLSKCKINDFDDIYYATKESQGYINAVLAIKYVLFNADDIVENTSENKYLFISSNNNARKKAMLMQQDDLGHILIKYCIASFGLRGKDFSITDDEFTMHRNRINRLDLTPYEMIEAVAYAAKGDINLAYSFLFENKKLLLDVVEYMIEERYIAELKDSLDNFSGIIDNNEISTETRYSFYEAWSNLDEAFAEIKRNNKEYIK